MPRSTAERMSISRASHRCSLVGITDGGFSFSMLHL
uniref:Uncharacterized protein n=1 Tax=Rhizophora mucronata TaxID=61149 RepID=A0A2P2PMR8_RHIMU